MGLRSLFPLVKKSISEVLVAIPTVVTAAASDCISAELEDCRVAVEERSLEAGKSNGSSCCGGPLLLTPPPPPKAPIKSVRTLCSAGEWWVMTEEALVSFSIPWDVALLTGLAFIIELGGMDFISSFSGVGLLFIDR